MSGQSRLQELVSDIDWEQDEAEKHRVIYEKCNKLASTAEQPPLYLLRYAICNIIHPTFVFEQVSELLTLLGHVELVRQKAVENANQLLELDGRHEQKAGGEAVVSMSAHERAQLSNVLKRIVEARETYVTCIKWIPLHYIRYLLTQGDLHEVQKCIENYHGDDPSDHLPNVIFYVGWSKEEMLLVTSGKNIAKTLILEAFTWEQDEAIPDNWKYDDATRRKFENEPRCSLELPLSTVVLLVDAYLLKVGKAVGILESFLGVV